MVQVVALLDEALGASLQISLDLTVGQSTASGNLVAAGDKSPAKLYSVVNRAVGCCLQGRSGL